MNRTEAFLLLWTLAGLAYAVYAGLFLPRELWVSSTVLRLSWAWPLIPFGLGLLIGHWLWPPGR